MALPANASTTCRILSIDGGGIRGVIPGQILAQLEAAIGVPLAQAFHMICGTSTGGILASGVAQEMPATQLLDFYFKDGNEIFNGSFLGSLGGPKYAPAPLESILQTTFGDTKLSDLKHDLLVPAYDIQRRADLLFESWSARGVQETDPSSNDFLLREVCRATSAAPTYFPPSLVTGQDGCVYPCIDGGMYANSPALLGLVTARKLMPLATRFLVVSLGTGELKDPLAYADATNWGLLGWAPQLIDVIFTAMNATVSYELDQLAPLVDQVRLQSDLAGASDALDDTTAANMTALKACAMQVLSDNAADVARIVEELKSPLPDRAILGYPTQVSPPTVNPLSDQTITQLTGQVSAALISGDWCAQADALRQLGFASDADALAPLCTAQKLAQAQPPTPPPLTAPSLLRGLGIGAALGLFVFGTPLGALFGAIAGFAAGRPNPPAPTPSAPPAPAPAPAPAPSPA
jgi:uncharacterized protein